MCDLICHYSVILWIIEKRRGDINAVNGDKRAGE